MYVAQFQYWIGGASERDGQTTSHEGCAAHMAAVNIQRHTHKYTASAVVVRWQVDALRVFG